MTQKTAKKQYGKYLRPNSEGRGHTAWAVVLAALLAVACLCFFAALWYRNTYGDLGFDSVLYTVFSDLGGVQSGLILDLALKAFLPAGVLTVLTVQTDMMLLRTSPLQATT